MSDKIIGKDKTVKADNTAKDAGSVRDIKDGNKKIIYKNKPSDKKSKTETEGIVKNKDAAQKPGKSKKEKKKDRKKEALPKVVAAKTPKVKKAVSNEIPFLVLTAISIVFLVLSALLLKPLISVDLSYKKVTLKYELYGNKSSSNVAEKTIFRDGKNVYVNFGAISATLGMHTVGNEDEVIFYGDSGDSIELKNNSEFAVINGIRVELDGAVLIEGSDIFIPATLLSRYSSGLTVVYNKSIERLTIATVKDEEKSNALQTVYKDFRMTLCENAACTPINENNIFGDNG